MLFWDTEAARIRHRIRMGGYAGMTELQFFAAEIEAWKDSQKRREQLAGEAYYAGDQEILRRQRTVIGEDGKLQAVQNLPDNRIVDNQFALMVDQKTNYLVGRPFTVDCKNKAYAGLLNQVFDKRFRRILKYVCEDALKGGIGWLSPFYGDGGELAFQHFPAHEILPFWADDDHTILDCAVRLYAQEVYTGYTRETVERVEIFRPDGIWRYVYSEPDGLIPDEQMGEHESYFRTGEIGLNWEKIPLIPFKYNKQEIPLIRRVKPLQDGINAMLSDFANQMQEDARNTILILKNYDGENLGEFRRNLAAYGAVKVRDDGGVDTLTVEVNAENFNAILKLLKDKLIENARGYNGKDDRMGNNPNQMNIQSLYSDIDLDANGMETEFQAAFDDLLWFLNQHFANTGHGEYDGEEADMVFNRDMLMNEKEIIESCAGSAGILSQETLVAQHPWTTDVEAELKRLRREKEESMQEYAGTFGAEDPLEEEKSGDG